jgi:hypothetical protein
MQIERWDPTANVTCDQEQFNELVSMWFVEAHRHVTVVGPVGVGKTFIAHALGHIACRAKYSALVVRTDKMLKTLKHARLDHSHEAELRKLLDVEQSTYSYVGPYPWFDGLRRDPVLGHDSSSLPSPPRERLAPSHDR